MVSASKVSIDSSSIYKNGEYLAQNEDWHAAESPWKAGNILKILQQNEIAFETAAEVGCGAGKILQALHQTLPEKEFTGFDISPQAASLWQATGAIGTGAVGTGAIGTGAIGTGAIGTEPGMIAAEPGVNYRLADFLATDETFDLLMSIDVFEHVPDYLGFLKQMRSRARYFIFHIPLDMNMLMLAKAEHSGLRDRIGHLHYFSRSTAEDTLNTCGYRIKDWFYTADYALPGHERKINSLRRLMFALSPEWAVKTLGGWSMMVLAESA
jgi:SAM-dependent methyltransferase